MNSGVTSINDLPSANSISQMPIQPKNNIIMNTMEQISQSTSQMPNQLPTPPPPMETRVQNSEQQAAPNYTEMVGQLQQAIQTGATMLPSKHVPIDPNKVTNDPNVQPNFIPNAENQNYIHNDMSVQDLINEDNTKTNSNKTYEQLFMEFKMPLLIGLLFFIFQIPTFKKFLRNSFPFLNAKDGNNNIYGYLFNTLIFVTTFYLLNKIIDNMTNYVM